MKAFIYIYTGKQSNVMTAFINVLQNLSFFFYLFNDFHRRIFFLSFFPERLPSLFPRHLWSFVCKELSFLITLSKKIKFNHTNDKDPNQVTNTLMKCWQMLEKNQWINVFYVPGKVSIDSYINVYIIHHASWSLIDSDFELFKYNFSWIILEC